MIKYLLVLVMTLSNFLLIPTFDSITCYRLTVEISNSQKIFISQNVPDSCTGEFIGCWNMSNTFRKKIFSIIHKGGYFLDKEKEFYIIEKYSFLHDELYGSIWNEKFIFDYRISDDSLFIESKNKDTPVIANTASVNDWTHFVGDNLRYLYNRKHEKLECGQMKTPHLGTHVIKGLKNQYDISITGFYSN